MPRKVTAGTPTVEFNFAYGGGKEATCGIYYISRGDRITTHHKHKSKYPMGGSLTRTYIETFITLKCMEVFDVAFDPAAHLICLVSAEIGKYFEKGFTCIPCTVLEAGDDNDINNRITEKTFKIAIIKRINVIAPTAGRQRSSKKIDDINIIASF